MGLKFAACRLVVLCLSTLVAGSALAQTDPFQSNPGPLPAPRAVAPPPRVTRPVPEPEVPPAPPPAPAVTETVPPGARLVASGVDSRIVVYRRWGDNCEAVPTTITIVEQPKHGAITLRDETTLVPLKAETGTSTGCIGKVVLGKGIHYQSELGYRGPDRVVFDVTLSTVNNALTRKTIEIAVR